MSLADHIKGALAGMVYGDSFGMPGELWPREKLRERLGEINDFLDGPQDNEVACYFKKGQYTDDSAQAFIILETLLEHKTCPSHAVIAQNLIKWVESLNGFEINLLGPSSKATLLAHKNGEDYTAFTKNSLTNGAAMRIAPVGCLFAYEQKEELVRTVASVSQATHNTEVTIAGAAMIAQAVCSMIHTKDYQVMCNDVCKAFDYSTQNFGEKTYSASLKRRFLLAKDFIDSLPKNPNHLSTTDLQSKKTHYQVLDFVYEVLGTGTATSESIPAALALAYYSQNSDLCAWLCANLGGDTDTIGAMAVAITGAQEGYQALNQVRINFIEQTNNLDLEQLSQRILNCRLEFKAP